VLLLHCDVSAVEEELVTNIGVSSNEVTDIIVCVAEPRTSSHFPLEYLQKVKQVHSKGGYESQGYGYDWKIEEAEKNLLRTHTTAVSARVLYRLAREVSVTFSHDFSHAYIFTFMAFNRFVSRDLKPRP